MVCKGVQNVEHLCSCCVFDVVIESWAIYFFFQIVLSKSSVNGNIYFFLNRTYWNYRWQPPVRWDYCRPRWTLFGQDSYWLANSQTVYWIVRFGRKTALKNHILPRWYIQRPKTVRTEGPDEQQRVPERIRRNRWLIQTAKNFG